MSGEVTPADGKPRGCETVMDLGFGACRLQVQVPVNGGYAHGRDLIGKNIGTSFVHLAQEYFTRLELEQDGEPANGDSWDPSRKLKTKIIELSGSVEAACALGVADGIVDLVGQCAPLLLCPGRFFSVFTVQRSAQANQVTQNRARR